jgi:hypothetical protein
MLVLNLTAVMLLAAKRLSVKPDAHVSGGGVV